MWINIEKKQPIHEQLVLITDGEIVTAAKADTKFYDDDRVYWDGCHFGGYEWDWDFDETAITFWQKLPAPDFTQM